MRNIRCRKDKEIFISFIYLFTYSYNLREYIFINSFFLDLSRIQISSSFVKILEDIKYFITDLFQVHCLSVEI